MSETRHDIDYSKYGHAHDGETTSQRFRRKHPRLSRRRALKHEIESSGKKDTVVRAVGVVALGVIVGGGVLLFGGGDNNEKPGTVYNLQGDTYTGGSQMPVRENETLQEVYADAEVYAEKQHPGKELPRECIVNAVINPDLNPASTWRIDPITDTTYVAKGVKFVKIPGDCL